MMNNVVKLDTTHLRPRFPKGYALLESGLGGYYFEDANGESSDDYPSPQAASKAARRHAKRQQASQACLAEAGHAG